MGRDFSGEPQAMQTHPAGVMILCWQPHWQVSAFGTGTFDTILFCLYSDRETISADITFLCY